MRILHRYIARDYLVMLGLSVAIFTFVLSIGSLVKVIDLMTRGVDAGVIIRYFLLNFPYILQYTVPMSSLTAVLLLFQRLSLDGEITAMKSGGLSLWQIVSPVVMFGIGLSLLGMVLSNELSPRSRYAQRFVQQDVKDLDPTALIEPGRHIYDFPDTVLFVGKRSGDNLSDVEIKELTRDGELKREIRARSGRLLRNLGEYQFQIDLFDVRIEEVDRSDPRDLGRRRVIVAANYPKRIDLRDLSKKSQASALYRLHFLTGPRAGLRVLFRPQKIAFGREVAGGIRLNDPALEPSHAVIVLRNGELQLRARTPTADVWRGDERVTEDGVVLAENDVFRLGTSRVRLERVAAVKNSDFGFRDLTDAVRNPALLNPNLNARELQGARMDLLVEANNRMALAMSCFAFTLLGIPLGLRSRRRESSVGVVFSLVIMFAFYFFLVVAKSLTDYPAWRPDLIVWIPIAVAEVLGGILISRSN